MSKTYTDDSIVSLNPREFTRLRPGVYVGSTEYSTQLLLEIVANAIDEFKAGHGNEINVTISKDNIITVSDQGQGFLINKIRSEDNKTVLEASFSVINTSGKYSDDGVYEGTALGLNGIGSKLPCFLSHWMKVVSCRDGKAETVNFKDGIFESRKLGVCDKEQHGTAVSWLVDEQFFTHPEVEINVVKNFFETVVCLCPGLTIILTYHDDKPISYFSKNGLQDLVDRAVEKSEILKNRLMINFSDNKNKLDLVLTYTDSYSSTIVPYVNTGLTESGNHITQLKTIITREMNKFFRDKEWLKEKDSNLTGDDCQEGMYLVFNITAQGVAYDAQTKSRIVKLDMTPFTQIFAEEFQYWMASNEKDLKQICDKALNSRKAREAARKARDAARGTKATKKESGLKAKMALSNKFIDCTNKNPSQRNLLLVEGLSAGSSAVEARNPKTDSIYMLRGKTVSPLKKSVTEILNNQEMSDIVKVIGAGFGENFDISKMNFDKIIITSDQDADGMNIELLLVTFFYTYMRELVLNGRLYRAVTPLYIIRQKGKEYYCYSDEELEQWKDSHKGNCDILRAKGLGELNPADLQKVCFEDERYKRITISNAEKTTELLEILMGTAVEPRKQYIFDNAKELGFNFD